MRNWYLIRTKVGAEQIASNQLQQVVDRVFLPVALLPFRQKSRTFIRKGPLFPTYLFAHFSLEQLSRQIRYTPGVRNVVTFGDQAAVVPTSIVDELMIRCAEAGIDLSKPKLLPGTPVDIVHGPFQDLEAVFEGYLSGTERVAVLLSVLNAKRRVMMPVSMVKAANETYSSFSRP